MLFHCLKKSEKVLLFQKTLQIFMNIPFFSCAAIFDLDLVRENVKT